MMVVLGFRNLFRNIRRTLAVLLTVALGTGALFCFQGFIHGVLTDYKETTIHSHYGDGQIHSKGYRETVYEEPWKHWILHWQQIEFALLEQEGVSYVFPRVSIPAMLTHDNVSITGSGQGVDAEKEAHFFNGLKVEEGESLTSQDNGIFLGKGLAQALGVHPGDQVTLYTKATDGSLAKARLKVTGIFYTGTTAIDNHLFRIPLKKAQELLNTDRVESIAVGLKSHDYWSHVSRMVQQTFPDLDVASFAELDKVYYQHSVDWLNAQFHVVQLIIVSIVLLGIFNTVSTAILERKQEIGNLRANGESMWDILKLILCEGFFLGFLGSLMGLIFTYCMAKGVLNQGILMPAGPGSTRQMFLSVQFTWVMVFSTFTLGLLSAMLASLLAGLKVAKMPIAKALRSI